MTLINIFRWKLTNIEIGQLWIYNKDADTNIFGMFELCKLKEASEFSTWQK